MGVVCTKIFPLGPGELCPPFRTFFCFLYFSVGLSLRQGTDCNVSFLLQGPLKFLNGPNHPLGYKGSLYPGRLTTGPFSSGLCFLIFVQGCVSSDLLVQSPPPVTSPSRFFFCITAPRRLAGRPLSPTVFLCHPPPPPPVFFPPPQISLHRYYHFMFYLQRFS